MRVRIKQYNGKGWWMVQYKEWYFPKWLDDEYFYSQEEAINKEKNLQSPAIIEIVPINKPANKIIHYTTGE